MKIALVDPSLFTWAYDAALTEGLLSVGHEVKIYARKPPHRVPAEQAHYISPHFYRLINGWWAKKLSPKAFLVVKGVNHIGSMFRFVWAMRREKPDVIHFQWIPLPIVDRAILPLLKRIAPLVLTVHDSAPFNDSPRSQLQKLNSTKIMKSFDRLIVHTQKAKTKIASYDVPIDRITVIQHGLFSAHPSPAPVPRTEDAGEISFLLFGYIKPYKGLDILVRAFAKMDKDVRDRCRIRVVGLPQMPMTPILDEIAAAGLSDRITLDLRFIDDDEIPSLLSSADALVFPYREIDASGVLMLALSAGKPIIASDLGLFHEILGDDEGALVPSTDVDALAAAMTALASDDDLRAAKARNVQALADSIPSWAVIAERTTRVYEDAIAERRLTTP
jgi:glycosyltransferase involved in cell wall biosynthesis